MERRLHRSRNDRIIAGVCGGLGEHLSIDPVWLRLLFILLLFAFGVGLWAYVILWIVVPEQGREDVTSSDITQADVQDMADSTPALGQGLQRDIQREPTLAGSSSSAGPAAIGVAFILLGAFLLLRQFDVFSWLRWDLMWPFLIILLGVTLLMSRLRE